MIETRRLKKCYFFPHNFRFCAVKRNYKYLQRFSTETWKCYGRRFLQVRKTRVQKKTEIRYDFLLYNNYIINISPRQLL